MKIGEFEILKKHAGARVSIILKTTIRDLVGNLASKTVLSALLDINNQYKYNYHLLLALAHWHFNRL
jgi:hypothetical protein